MVIARWCPEHELVLEETWAGLRCPAGHDWIFGHEQCQRPVWVVDMERDVVDEKFCLYIINDPTKPSSQGGLFSDPLASGMDVREGGGADTHPNYLEHIEHWARPRKIRKKDMHFVERALKGRI